MKTQKLIEEMEKEFDERFIQDDGPFPGIPMPVIMKKDNDFSGKKVKIKGRKEDFIMDGWNTASIEDIKSFIRIYTKKLIQSVSEEVIDVEDIFTKFETQKNDKHK